VEGGQKRLHERLQNLYALPNITKMIKSRMRWIGHVACMKKMRNAYRILIREPKQKKSLGRPRHRWEDNTGMDFREIGCKGVDWII
jgi:hypothetical protein